MTKESKFTQGPYRIVRNADGGPAIQADAHKNFCLAHINRATTAMRMAGCIDGDPTYDAQAVAQLFAAAPELFEAARIASDAIKKMRADSARLGTGQDGGIPVDALLDAALAKALGK